MKRPAPKCFNFTAVMEGFTEQSDAIQQTFNCHNSRRTTAGATILGLYGGRVIISDAVPSETHRAVAKLRLQ